MRKNLIKIILDVLMLFVVALFYNKNTIGMAFHEIGGLVICGVFIVHILLNIPWLRKIPRRLFDKALPLRTRLGIVVNLLLSICFLLIVSSGIMISKTIFTGLSHSWFGWKTVHYFCSALTIILLGIHIGLHLPWLKGIWSKHVRLPHVVGRILLIVVMVIILCYGGYSFVTGNMGRWLSMPFSSASSMPSHGQERPAFTEGVQFGERNLGREEGRAAKGLAQGKGSPQVSASNIFKQLATYGSMILSCTIATGFIVSIRRKRKVSDNRSTS